MSAGAPFPHCGAAHGASGGPRAGPEGSRASSLPSTALVTSAPSLPTHPPRPGPRRAISGDLALSRVISRGRAILFFRDRRHAKTGGNPADRSPG